MIDDGVLKVGERGPSIRAISSFSKTIAPGYRVGWLLAGKFADAAGKWKLSMSGVSVTPGVLFSSTDKFKNCIRVSCGMPWNDRIEAAVKTVGRIARNLAAGTVH